MSAIRPFVEGEVGAASGRSTEKTSTVGVEVKVHSGRGRQLKKKVGAEREGVLENGPRCSTKNAVHRLERDAFRQRRSEGNDSEGSFVVGGRCRGSGGIHLWVRCHTHERRSASLGSFNIRPAGKSATGRERGERTVLAACLNEYRGGATRGILSKTQGRAQRARISSRENSLALDRRLQSNQVERSAKFWVRQRFQPDLHQVNRFDKEESAGKGEQSVRNTRGIERCNPNYENELRTRAVLVDETPKLKKRKMGRSGLAVTLWGSEIPPTKTPFIVARTQKQMEEKGEKRGQMKDGGERKKKGHARDKTHLGEMDSVGPEEREHYIKRGKQKKACK